MPEQQTRLLASRYELIAPLGRGTMGTVWRAHDRLLGRDVAVKEIRHDPGLSKSQRDELRERMIREGRAAAKIAHPSVATVHDAIVVDGSPWIVMELVEARSLDQVIDEEGPLPPRLVAEIGLDLLGALGAAHEQGILHRDVKPANVLLTETGRVVLTDFGIAKAEGDSNITETGMVIGSPGYTAPERARGDHTGPESDLWSLGATLYFAVEGRPAYERRTVGETLAALMTEQADPATQAGPLRPVLEALLEKDHTKRLTRDRATTMLRAVARTPATPTPNPPRTPAKTPNLPSTTPNTPSETPHPTSSTPDTPPKSSNPPPRTPGTPPSNPSTAPKTPAAPTSTSGSTAGTPAAPSPTPGTAAPAPGQNPTAGQGPAHQSAGAHSAGSRTTPPAGGGGKSSADAVASSTGGGRPAVKASVDAESGAAGEPRDTTDAEAEPDPNQTMVVIRPKGGLRIPGVNPQTTPPDRPTAGTSPGSTSRKAPTGKASSGPIPPTPAVVDRTAGGRDGADDEDPGEDDQATMVGLLPPIPGDGPASRAAGPSSPPRPAGPPSRTAGTPAGRPAGSSGGPGPDRRTAASASDGPTRPPSPARATAPSRRFPAPEEAAPPDATPPEGFAAPVEPAVESGTGTHPAPGAPPKPRSAPGSPLPAGPGASGPGPSSGPGTPSGPGAPSRTGTPSPPGTPSGPGTPFRPGAPSAPGTPSGPGAPETPASRYNPGVPGEGSEGEKVHQESGLGTDLFAFQGTASPRSNSPAGMIVLIAVALLGLAAIVMLAAAALSDTGSVKGSGPSGTSRENGSTSATGSRTPGEAESVNVSVPGAEAAPSTAPAPGFRRYEDVSGYAIDLPERLQSTPKGRSVGFGADGDVRAARVSRSPETSADILNTAKAAEARALKAGTYPGYKRLRLIMTRPTPYPGTDVADWEFTYTATAGPVHVLSRWVAVPGGPTYAIYWSTPQSRWDAHRPQLATVLSSFRPARADAPGGS
ncbi:serine/threonine-protein kinase [Sphaerisporangium album]|uniref:serine/threonine-protein kinase n=1 Tax=Sphaerisporangium album TaxID=509200 RepID=UPI001C6902B6|nr:serine/threonine-protein kinase [Sphaerisporangium album]